MLYVKIGDLSIPGINAHFPFSCTNDVCSTTLWNRIFNKEINPQSFKVYKLCDPLYRIHGRYTHVIRYLRDANEKKKKSCCDTTKPSQVYFLIYYNFHRQTTIDATTDRRPPIIYINTGIVVKNPFLSRTDDSTLFRSHRNNRSLFLYDSLMWIFHVD